MPRWPNSRTAPDDLTNFAYMGAQGVQVKVIGPAYEGHWEVRLFHPNGLVTTSYRADESLSHWREYVPASSAEVPDDVVDARTAASSPDRAAVNRLIRAGWLPDEARRRVACGAERDRATSAEYTRLHNQGFSHAEIVSRMALYLSDRAPERRFEAEEAPALAGWDHTTAQDITEEEAYRLRREYGSPVPGLEVIETREATLQETREFYDRNLPREEVTYDPQPYPPVYRPEDAVPLPARPLRPHFPRLSRSLPVEEAVGWDNENSRPIDDIQEFLQTGYDRYNVAPAAHSYLDAMRRSASNFGVIIHDDLTETLEFDPEEDE